MTTAPMTSAYLEAVPRSQRTAKERISTSGKRPIGDFDIVNVRKTAAPAMMIRPVTRFTVRAT